ncbi:MAG: nickel-dependent lactate racemase [Lachnospiraceae bacterium]|nr:nickel-dependent lactate racemase [Lachnospiraceae bacterium]
MPLLLPEDYAISLPAMHRVRQNFDRTRLEDVEGTVRRELARPEIRGKVHPGSRVAVAVGSRGIRNLPCIVKTVIEELQALGAEPFIVSAMGSHGGGTAEGQREVLTGYGITEEAMGVPVKTDTDVVHLGETSRGIQVWFDKNAFEADLIVPINRVKLHTDFVAPLQSGICKMLVIGLGNHRGCSAIHEEEFSHFGETLQEAATLILEHAPVGFGVAILENAYDETYGIHALPRETLIEDEIELVKQARKNMPILMIPQIDILIVEQIGKDISGAGFDPNILGKSYILNEFVLDVPEINRMVLLDISPASHGNGIGLGVFDIITRKVFEQLDYEAMYANAIAIKCVDDCKVPLIAADEDEAVKIAVKILRGVDREHLKIVRIRSTLELEEIQVSEALLPVVEADSRLELLEA